MSRFAIATGVDEFYSLGNTPAVCLTQDLPPEDQADILLLGCGDSRHVLFASFTDPSRKLDITCCDRECAILARNILLYTLLIDDTKGSHTGTIWNVYYHLKLDKESLSFLEGQADKLVSLSSTTNDRRASQYGKIIRLCTEHTLTRVRKSWEGYSTRGLTEAEKFERVHDYKNSTDHIISRREQVIKDKIVTHCGMRSMEPAGFRPQSVLTHAAMTWCNKGVTSPSENTTLAADNLNATFFSLTNPNLMVHDAIDPFTGFPLASAYICLSSGPSAETTHQEDSTFHKFSMCGRKQFKQWAMAFKEAALANTVLRFCLADAQSFAFALQHARLNGFDTPPNPSLFTDNWTFDKLMLDQGEYNNSKAAAPYLFHVVETSNIMDYIGPLNLVPILSSLLKDSSTSVAYTESLGRTKFDTKEDIGKILGIDIRSMALLVGLSPCEIWTNITNTGDDQSMIKIDMLR